MAERRKPTHQKKKRRAKRKESSFLRTALTLCFCVLAFVFSAFLWREALRVSSQEQGSVSASGEAFRPHVGDPPYRVAIDAGHGGNDPGARGVVEEKDMTAATASVLLAWLEQDPNYIPLRTRDAFDQTATPAERMRRNKGCPICKSLLKKRPDVAVEWHPTKNAFGPETVTPMSHKEAWFICQNCHREYNCEIAARVRRKGPNCPHCR